jgi:hypothetical protein
MLKKILACTVVSAFLVCGGITTSFAADKGSEQLVINEAGKKPVAFPHKKHQDAFPCSECHHGIKDGKQVPYVEGQEIQKCETCHNDKVLAGKKAGNEKLDTLKGAGHANCLACHKKNEKKELAKCTTCHSIKK